MFAFRLPAAVVAAGAVSLLPGCLTLYSKTDVVRSEESRRPVRFESPDAAQTFHTAAKKYDGKLGGAYFGVPFVTLYNRDKVLSESARFNDAVCRCDTDQDGLISAQEADIFARNCN